MAYSKTVRRHRKRGKKGGVETRGQKRRVEEELPAVETTMREAPSKKATTKKAPKDPEILELYKILLFFFLIIKE